VAGSPTSFRVEVLPEDEWSRLRHIRLAALADYPAAFLSSHDVEAAYDEQQWRREFARGEWNIIIADGEEVGLLGVTREPGMSSQECYLEYLWVAPGFRRSGVGSALLRTVLDGLRDFGVHTVWLYILNGNQAAMRLYQRFGFQRTNERQLLPDHPAGSEERMKLRLN
jgi:ribosomal protein S18 acetylase RimI-like enzyme